MTTRRRQTTRVATVKDRDSGTRTRNKENEQEAGLFDQKAKSGGVASARRNVLTSMGAGDLEGATGVLNGVTLDVMSRPAMPFLPTTPVRAIPNPKTLPPSSNPPRTISSPSSSENGPSNSSPHSEESDMFGFFAAQREIKHRRDALPPSDDPPSPPDNSGQTGPVEADVHDGGAGASEASLNGSPTGSSTRKRKISQVSSVPSSPKSPIPSRRTSGRHDPNGLDSGTRVQSSRASKAKVDSGKQRLTTTADLERLLPKRRSRRIANRKPKTRSRDEDSASEAEITKPRSQRAQTQRKATGQQRQGKRQTKVDDEEDLEVEEIKVEHDPEEERQERIKLFRDLDDYELETETVLWL